MDLTLAATLWRLAAVLALVLANGFFVAAEFSIVTVRKTRIDQLIAEGHRGARAVRRAVSNPDPFIAATQLGITMASIGLGWIGEPALAGMLQPAIAFLPVGIAETTAKTIALDKAEATALVVVKPTELFMKAFWPFIRILNGTGRAVVRMLGLHSDGGHSMVHSEAELKMLVTASQEAGVLEEQEEQMLHRVFGFADLTAGQVMIPRTELVAVSADTPLRDLMVKFGQGSFTRLPVYREDLDDVVGMVHVTDVLRALAEGPSDVNAGALAREVLTVPITLGADDLLAEMRRRRAREALVIDEYGGTAGLVTFESLMERIIGEIPGEMGAQTRTTLRPDGSADIDGLALVGDVNEQFGLHLDDDTYTTIGGYVLGRLGRRARVGDTLDVDARKMRVESLDGLRVAKVWLSRPDQKPEGPPV
jgi:CBS domain containing-hemolysin-like protein